MSWKLHRCGEVTTMNIWELCPELLFAPGAFSFLSVLSSFFFFPGWRQIFGFSRHFLFIFNLPNAGIHSLGPKGVVGYSCGEGQHSCTGTLVHEVWRPKLWLSSSVCFPPTFWDKVSFWTWSSLVSKSREFACVSLPSSGITGIHHCAWILCKHWGPALGSSHCNTWPPELCPQLCRQYCGQNYVMGKSPTEM